MKSKYPLVVSILFFALTLVLSGCSSTEEKGPIGSLELSDDKISVNSGSISKDFITITVTREDEGEGDVNFTIKFPERLNDVYPADAEGKRIEELNITLEKYSGSKSIKLFKVFGKTEFDNNPSRDLTVELWFNNTLVSKPSEKITVKVKR